MLIDLFFISEIVITKKTPPTDMGGGKEMDDTHQ